uniref:Uncharacterized protein n=1 Tax=Urocitellus parryii TaxID=9999 RepID=A0A8D2KKH0_UROPR
ISFSTQTPTVLTQRVHSCLSTHSALDCFLQRLGVSPSTHAFFFFFHICNKPSSLCSWIVYDLCIFSMHSFDV